jgi:hypothetical protein
MDEIRGTEKSGGRKKDSLLRKPSRERSLNMANEMRKKEMTFLKDPVKQSTGTVFRTRQTTYFANQDGSL